jgi:hypothetical protein
MRFGHAITVKYYGPTNSRGSRYRIQWQGWPSDDWKPVTTWVPFDYEHPDGISYEDVAQRFIDWINEGLTALDNKLLVADVIIGAIDSDTHVVTVITKHQDDA